MISTSEVRPLGAKDSLKGVPGVTKSKKKKKKNLDRAVREQLESTAAVDDISLQDAVPAGVSPVGPLNWYVSFSEEKQRYVCVFCDTTADLDYLLEDHVRFVHEDEYGAHMRRLAKPQYPCDRCRYVASSEFRLIMHMEDRHNPGNWR